MHQGYQEKTWDRFWSSWLNKFIIPFRLIVNNLYIHKIKKYIDGRTLEIGCGSSYCSKKLKTYGLDISKNVIQYRNKGRFVIGDARNLPFKDNTFGLVWSAGLLEHFIRPDKIITESKRVGKTVIAFVPSNIEPLARLTQIYGEMTIYSRKTLYLLFKRFFDHVETSRFHLTIMGIGLNKEK